MIAEGIIDPAKVTRSALQNAASIAALFLTTEAVIADKPEKAAPAARWRRDGRHGLLIPRISSTHGCNGGGRFPQRGAALRRPRNPSGPGRPRAPGCARRSPPEG